MEYPLVNVETVCELQKNGQSPKCRNVVDLPIDRMVNLSSSFLTFRRPGVMGMDDWDSEHWLC